MEIINRTTLTASLIACSLIASSSALAAGSKDYKGEVANYYQAGVAAQISTHSIGLAYYGDSHDYTVGVSLSPYLYLKDGSVTTREITADIFARKNFALTDRLMFGAGLSATAISGSVSAGRSYNSNGWAAAQYIILEYAATKNVLIGAPVNTVFYTNRKIGGLSVKHWQFLDGASLQFSYIF